MYRHWIIIPKFHQHDLHFNSPTAANAFSIFSGLLFALFYQVYLRYNHTEFYRKFRFVSTSGFNSGVGIGGLILLLFQALRIGKSVDFGGPVGDGCLVPVNMPQY